MTGSIWCLVSLMMAPNTRAETCCIKTLQHKENCCDWRLLSYNGKSQLQIKTFKYTLIFQRQPLAISNLTRSSRNYTLSSKGLMSSIWRHSSPSYCITESKTLAALASRRSPPGMAAMTEFFQIWNPHNALNRRRRKIERERKRKWETEEKWKIFLFGVGKSISLR